MPFGKEEHYATTVHLFGRNRIIRSSSFVTFMFMLAIVNFILLLPFPLTIVPRFALALSEFVTSIFVFIRALWLFVSATQSPNRRLRQSQARVLHRHTVPKMHILAGTFGAVCQAERRRSSGESALNLTSTPPRARTPGQKRVYLDVEYTNEKLAKPDNQTNMIKTPPDLLTPQNSPTLPMFNSTFFEDDEDGKHHLPSMVKGTDVFNESVSVRSSVKKLVRT